MLPHGTATAAQSLRNAHHRAALDTNLREPPFRALRAAQQQSTKSSGWRSQPSLWMGLYSSVEVHVAAGADLGPSREYNIDLAPRVRLWWSQWHL